MMELYVEKFNDKCVHSLSPRLNLLLRLVCLAVTEQLKSVQKLLELDFEWILPGEI